ncbi:hypothetical protein RhiirA5_463020 [Rhizophagus irregularis]|uniref:K-box domain-containing protein n=1 Tax=Rhizophagus irregularis TaxID=588596 RepID=A0A2N0SGQ5_9GLOM|nr:hypothetical protein RhiirA5_463020 [Rhizophagus irregularis]PKC74734.1 hypothetical protein RhiirA1_529323 [Rhizophagus irregularis]
MNLLEKFDKLNNKLTNLLEENKELKQQNKNLQEENQVLKEKLNERDYKNLQEEIKKLKQHVLNLENKKNEQLEITSQNLEEYKRKYKILQEENKNLNERETQFQQHIQNLEKQKSEQLEIFSQNLEKALGKLELDELDEDDNVQDPEDKEPAPVSLPKKAPNKEPAPTPLPKKVSNKEPVSLYKSNQIYSYLWDKSSGNSSINDNIRVVVGLDFGTTYSGFSYCHVNSSSNISTNDVWPGSMGQFKTNTVLQYDHEYGRVESWGLPALAKRPSRRKNENRKSPVELFKLHLGDLPDNLKPKLPIDYKKAITDYLREIGKTIKEIITEKWPNCGDILLVLTVPTESSNKEKAIMRNCAFYAGLIKDKNSMSLQFTTESEAAAIYCMNSSLREYDLSTTERTFMIVDCGGGTIDITTRKLVGNNQLGEVTESIGDFCGSTFIDNEFIKFLRNKLGNSTIDLLIKHNYGQFQYMIQEFCRLVKLPFTGDDLNFSYELDIEEVPDLKQYVGKENRDTMEDNDWVIKINYEDIKAMFDPVVDRIIKLIHSQLSNAREECSAMFLVGGFSGSIYLQNRIKQEFQHRVKNISVPTNPIAAISRGAVMFGSSLKNSENNIKKINLVIHSRVLRYTYGIQVRNYWNEGDPVERKMRNGRIDRFSCIVRRGQCVSFDQVFPKIFTPLSPMQKKVCFRIHYTKEYDALYCDEPGMELLGTLTIYLHGSGTLDNLSLAFTFGRLEIAATAKNETSGRHCKTTFEIND